MCHIGVTTFISKRKYSWRSINPQQLEIIEFSPVIRVSPSESFQSKDPRTCIGIYSLKTSAGLTIIGNIDTSLVYDKPLTFEVGNGTKGDFPLCGPITEGIGHEAVVAWKIINGSKHHRGGI